MLPSRAPTVQKCLLYATGFAALLAIAIWLRLNPGVFDYAAARVVNQFIAANGAAARIARAGTFPAVQGLGVVVLACACWFARTSPEARIRLIRGCIAAVLAAVLAHVMQASLPSMPKPIFDPGLHMQPADTLGDIQRISNPQAQSFPSERATLFAGIAIAAYRACPSIGLLALAGTVMIEFCRVVLDLHYPSDVLGSFWLAGTMYWILQAAPLFGLDRMAVAWERGSPATFYGLAFAACYGLATAFEDVLGFLLFLTQ